MKDSIKNIIKQFSRNNIFFYRLVSFAQNMYGRLSFLGGKLSVSSHGCVKLNKNVIGKGNSFVSDKGCLIDRLGVKIVGNNNRIRIGKNCTIQKGCHFWIIGNNCSIEIGDDTRIGSFCSIEVQEDYQFIKIGKDNLWSHNVRLRNNDSHYIYNLETGLRTNQPKPIVIDDHVWLAAYVTILKGVHVESGSVIGTHALVTKDVPSHVVAVGIPAKVIQNSIEWTDAPKA